MQNIQIRLANSEDITSLIRAGTDLFDHPVKPDRAKEFFEDPRHHLVVAFDGGQAVGFASAMHYIHPDKDPQMFVNEVSVINAYQNQGVGRSLVKFIVDYSKVLGCVEAWIATEVSNQAAIKAYLAAGAKMEGEHAVVMVWEL